MKREDIVEIFPEATKEQIDSILNKAGSELTALNERLTEANAKFNDASKSLAEKTESVNRLEAENKELKEKVEAGMTAEQLLEAREKDAAEKEREFAIKSNTLDARSIFQEAGLSTEEVEELVQQVVSEDADKTKALATQIAEFTKAQREAAVQATKDDLMKNNPSLQGAGSEGAVTTKEQFGKLTFTEQAKLLEENPSLLSSLS